MFSKFGWVFEFKPGPKVPLGLLQSAFLRPIDARFSRGYERQCHLRGTALVVRFGTPASFVVDYAGVSEYPDADAPLPLVETRCVLLMRIAIPG
jgi:hypothetical protein